VREIACQNAACWTARKGSAHAASSEDDQLVSVGLKSKENAKSHLQKCLKHF